MAKRKSRKSKKSFPWGFFLLIIAVLAVLAIYSYKTNPEFKSQADEIAANFKEAGESVQEKVSTTIDSYIEETDSKSEEAQTSSRKDSKSAEEKNSSVPPKTTSTKKIVVLPKGLEIPVCAGNHGKKSGDHQIRNFENYSLCYRESYEQAEWSAYCLTEDELVKNAKRSDDFRSDPEITTGSATPADYKKSGYDRGHLSPAADFAFSEKAMSETFYMSNMSPQKGSLNRGIWKDLESKVREWAGIFGRIYVVSGPILEKPSAEYKSIGENQVAVPEYYYKVILAPLYADEKDKSTPEDAESVLAMAYIFPNEKCEGTLDDYAVTVDEVEKRTGLDFFAPLPDSIENEMEAKVRR